MLTMDSLAEEHHVKDSVDTSGTAIIKYLDSVSVSLRFSVSAYPSYTCCAQSFTVGVSFMKSCFFTEQTDNNRPHNSLD